MPTQQTWVEAQLGAVRVFLDVMGDGGTLGIWRWIVLTHGLESSELMGVQSCWNVENVEMDCFET